MKKIISFILGTIKFILFSIIIIYLLFVCYQRFFNSSIFGYRIYTVSSGSMEPNYDIGDVILIKDVSESDIQIGDVITYIGKSRELNGLTITHRITRIYSREGNVKIITKGDNNEAEDPELDYNQVVGKFVTKLELFSMFTKATNNKFIFFFGAFVPLVVIFFLETVDTFNDYKDYKNSKREESDQDEE